MLKVKKEVHYTFYTEIGVIYTYQAFESLPKVLEKNPVRNWTVSLLNKVIGKVPKSPVNSQTDQIL